MGMDDDDDDDEDDDDDDDDDDDMDTMEAAIMATKQLVNCLFDMPCNPKEETKLM